MKHIVQVIKARDIKKGMTIWERAAFRKVTSVQKRRVDWPYKGEIDTVIVSWGKVSSTVCLNPHVDVLQEVSL